MNMPMPKSELGTPACIGLLLCGVRNKKQICLVCTGLFLVLQLLLLTFSFSCWEFPKQHCVVIYADSFPCVLLSKMHLVIKCWWSKYRTATSVEHWAIACGIQVLLYLLSGSLHELLPCKVDSCPRDVNGQFVNPDYWLRVLSISVSVDFSQPFRPNLYHT